MSQTSERPSPVLLAMLVATILAAAVYYGGVFGGEDDTVDDSEFIESVDDAGSGLAAPIDGWDPPAEPRNPFAPVGGFAGAGSVDTDALLVDGDG